MFTRAAEWNEPQRNVEKGQFERNGDEWIRQPLLFSLISLGWPIQAANQSIEAILPNVLKNKCLQIDHLTMIIVERQKTWLCRVRRVWIMNDVWRVCVARAMEWVWKYMYVCVEWHFIGPHYGAHFTHIQYFLAIWRHLTPCVAHAV